MANDEPTRQMPVLTDLEKPVDTTTREQAPDTTTRVHCIVAMARNRVIGCGGKLPWHLPEDMKHFREMTMGHAVIMGRKTLFSIPPSVRPLPGRMNIIVSRTIVPGEGSVPGARVVDNVVAAIGIALDSGKQPWIIGGGQIYEAALPFITDLHVTHVSVDVDHTLPGAILFPINPYAEDEVWEELDDNGRKLSSAAEYAHYRRRA